MEAALNSAPNIRLLSIVFDGNSQICYWKMPEEILKCCMVLFSKMASATPKLIEFCLMTKKNYVEIWRSQAHCTSSPVRNTGPWSESVADRWHIWNDDAIKHLVDVQITGVNSTAHAQRASGPDHSTNDQSSVFRTVVLFPDTTYIFILTVKWHEHISKYKKYKRKSRNLLCIAIETGSLKTVHHVAQKLMCIFLPAILEVLGYNWNKLMHKSFCLLTGIIQR